MITKAKHKITLNNFGRVTVIDAPNDWTDTAPQGCDFKLGDTVEYTNCNGAKIDLKIWGFANPEKHGGKRCVYLHTDCYWFPVDPDSCKVLSRGTK